MEDVLAGLRAIAEPTRLRILVLCARSELSVTELVDILGQSQPRVSRHLKLMVEAGVLERNSEGARAYYRLAERTAGGGVARALTPLVPVEDATVETDLARKQFEAALGEGSGLDDRGREVLYNLGLIYEAEGDHAQARSCYSRIFETDIGYRDVAAKMERLRTD